MAPRAALMATIRTSACVPRVRVTAATHSFSRTVRRVLCQSVKLVAAIARIIVRLIAAVPQEAARDESPAFWFYIATTGVFNAQVPFSGDFWMFRWFIGFEKYGFHKNNKPLTKWRNTP